MRVSKVAFVTLFAVAQLVGTSVAGQQVAAVSKARDCPTQVPDSLQISWTAPCDENDWVLNPEAGCGIGDWHPAPEDRALWSGACPGGNKDGQGVVQWTERGHAIDRFEGTFRNGKREGAGRYVWAPGVSFQGLYAHDLPNGLGTVTLFGESLSGTWKDGCLTMKGRVVAIGVDRSSCGAARKTAL